MDPNIFSRCRYIPQIFLKNSNNFCAYNSTIQLFFCAFYSSGLHPQDFLNCSDARSDVFVKDLAEVFRFVTNGGNTDNISRVLEFFLGSEQAELFLDQKLQKYQYIRQCMINLLGNYYFGEVVLNQNGKLEDSYLQEKNVVEVYDIHDNIINAFSSRFYHEKMCGSNVQSESYINIVGRFVLLGISNSVRELKIPFISSWGVALPVKRGSLFGKQEWVPKVASIQGFVVYQINHYVPIVKYDDCWFEIDDLKFPSLVRLSVHQVIDKFNLAEIVLIKLD